jgi:endonuclease YncB( thermonuclease family)
MNGHPDQFTGKVTEVYSGDPLGILVDGAPVRIHLHGIDCPHKDQPFANEAKAYTSALTYGKMVTVHITNSDRRGGKIGKVMLPGEKNLNWELVKAGLAWWNRQSAPDDRILQAFEKSAKNNRLGLWVDPEPVPPRENRQSTTIHPADSPEQTMPSRSFDNETTVYITSTGEKYHRHECRYLMKSMIPIRLGDARTRDLVPCPVCDPPK